jgi:hypothetical protein
LTIAQRPPTDCPQNHDGQRAQADSDHAQGQHAHAGQAQPQRQQVFKQRQPRENQQRLINGEVLHAPRDQMARDVEVRALVGIPAGIRRKVRQP